ncbi:YiiG family protein [Tardiphaga sp.]|uniref:YiiG family protein n=1 Tax=Tardiphaga sp. TaxID=1926292 RepID=UPI0025D985E8|nr:YiiG family protein [Tardiphaga sp.]
MTSIRASIAVALVLASVIYGNPASAQTPPATEKLNAYVGCINRLSARALESRARYFSWVGKSGPTGKERIIYGLYTIYDTADCQKKAEAANALEPRDAALEAAATAYVTAVTALGPLLKETDDYYTQENYKDDKMAKGKALHPRLVAAWDAFASADRSLRDGVEAINDRRKAEELMAIEATEGRSARYHVAALMIGAKRVLRAEDATSPDIAAITKAVEAYEATVKAIDASGATGDAKVGSMFISQAKSFLTTAKQLMRRIRDKVPYSTGDKMMLSDTGSGWMVQGSSPRLLRDYNQLVDAYNSGARM